MAVQAMQIQCLLFLLYAPKMLNLIPGLPPTLPLPSATPASFWSLNLLGTLHLHDPIKKQLALAG